MGKLTEVAKANAHKAGLKYCVAVRRIWATWEKFDDEDRAYVAEAMTPDTMVSTRALAKGLAAVGLKIYANRIAEHRNGTCACKEASPWAS